jgi:phosphoglycolate phosphatase-like HAD superfamily hydrolase
MVPRMRGLGGLIFDLDGTLADTLPLCYAAYADAFARFTGRTVGPAEIRRLFGPSEEGIVRRVVPDRCEECLEVYLSFYDREHGRNARLFSGVVQLLDWLKARGALVGVVTGKGQRSAELSLQHLGLGRYLDGLGCGSSEGDRKAAALRELAMAWGLAPSAVAYVGDAPSDMQAAVLAGLLPLGAAWDREADGPALRQVGAAAVFRSPEELRAWLSSAN